MAPRSMTLDVLVRLKDLLSGPLRGLQTNLERIGNMAKKIGVVGTAIAAISFMAPIKEAAAFQQKLVDIASTANLSGAAAFSFVDQAKGRYEELALKIGQYSDTIAEGAGQMIAAGIDEKLVDRSMNSVGKAATAAHAQFSDMAGVATSLLQTMKLPVNQLDDTFAAMIVGAKEGSFEMRDMAKYFPTLTGQMAKLGITGRNGANQLVAMLEIAKKGTADPAEAANNLNNFLSKITSPETVKNFKKMNVDIVGVMQDAAVKGISPIEAVIQKISKISGVSGKEISGLMAKAKKNGLQGTEALAEVQKQLVAIHGSSALGGLFSDMQVMGFLIPMLGNIEEYKRIKDEVSKATGAITDRDFETQMMALNQQLTIFGEIGTQVTREVGLAFGEWLPAINNNLEAALKWVREFDAETGGMVKRSLMFAGAGVLVAAALGALGVVLPMVAAGFGAVAALVSPVGVALGLIAYAAVQIYKNWGAFGPRIIQTWQFLKRGFFDLAEGLKERGQRILDYGSDLVDRYGPMIRSGFARAWDAVVSGAPAVLERLRSIGSQIVAAGGELADRFGPRIRDGLASAWADIKVGLDNLRGLFDGFMTGLDLKIDLSGLTIDNAKVAVFERLDAALKGIAAGWETLKNVGEGFKPYLKGMGEDLGGTVKSAGEFANNLVRLVDALAKLGSPKKSDDMTVIDVDKIAGDLAGGSLGLALKMIREVADAFVGVSNNLATLAETVNKGIDWKALLPDAVTDAWNRLAGVIEKVKGLLDFKGGALRAPDVSPTAANQNNPAFHEAPSHRQGLAPAVAAQAPNGKVTVDVRVTGPGQVTGVTSSNPSVVPATADTGRAVGRP